jgi:hypothetical protein
VALSVPTVTLSAFALDTDSVALASFDGADLPTELTVVTCNSRFGPFVTPRVSVT